MKMCASRFCCLSFRSSRRITSVCNVPIPIPHNLPLLRRRQHDPTAYYSLWKPLHVLVGKATQSQSFVTSHHQYAGNVQNRPHYQRHCVYHQIAVQEPLGRASRGEGLARGERRATARLREEGLVGRGAGDGAGRERRAVEHGAVEGRDRCRNSGVFLE